jgi:hypothetical protein
MAGGQRMKRDLDLIRDIMLAISDMEPVAIEVSPWQEIHIIGRSEESIEYHIKLIEERGFLRAEAVNFNSVDANKKIAVRLRYDALSDAGHDFLDTIRDDNIWGQTKTKAKKAGVGALSFVWEIAKAVTKAEIRKQTGFDIS